VTGLHIRQTSLTIIAEKISAAQPGENDE